MLPAAPGDYPQKFKRARNLPFTFVVDRQRPIPLRWRNERIGRVFAPAWRRSNALNLPSAPASPTGAFPCSRPIIEGSDTSQTICERAIKLCGTKWVDWAFGRRGLVMHHHDQLKHIRVLKDRANEVRAVASSIDDKECRATLARLAGSYESMVEGAQKAHVAGRGLKESCTPR